MPLQVRKIPVLSSHRHKCQVNLSLFCLLQFSYLRINTTFCTGHFKYIVYLVIPILKRELKYLPKELLSREKQYPHAACAECDLTSWLSQSAGAEGEGKAEREGKASQGLRFRPVTKGIF